MKFDDQIQSELSFIIIINNNLMTEPSRALWSDRTTQKSELKGQNGHLATNK